SSIFAPVTIPSVRRLSGSYDMALNKRDHRPIRNVSRANVEATLAGLHRFIKQLTWLGKSNRYLERIPLRFEHSLYGERSSCTLLPRNRQRSVRSGAIDAEWCARRPCAGQPSLC